MARRPPRRRRIAIGGAKRLKRPVRGRLALSAVIVVGSSHERRGLSGSAAPVKEEIDQRDARSLMKLNRSLPRVCPAESRRAAACCAHSSRHGPDCRERAARGSPRGRHRATRRRGRTACLRHRRGGSVVPTAGGNRSRRNMTDQCPVGEDRCISRAH